MANDSETPDPNLPDPAWVRKIQLKALELCATPKDGSESDERPNLVMNDWIKDVWERDSPRFWKQLTGVSASFPGELATVLQAEMRCMERELMRGGMYYTDAREMAERETLMLEPEDQYDEELEMWTPDLPLPLKTTPK